MKTIKVVCSNCNKKFERPINNHRKNQKNRFCSIDCMSDFRKDNGNPCYKGGKVENFCLVCGDKFYTPKKDTERRKTCSMECRNIYISEWQKKYCWLIGLPSDLHPNWKGGTSFDQYPKEFYNIKEEILQRDCRCIECDNEEDLCVHHIDYDKKNNKEENLIILCRSCHSKTNYNRNYWNKRYESYAILQ